MNTAGLSTDQAPPLAVPLCWYAIAPCALLAAGALLVAEGGRVLYTGWLPATAALAHLLTLGVLGAAMAGSLYQMVPVVAGSPIPWPRMAHAVALSWAVGVAALCSGLALGRPALLQVALVALAVAFAGFLVPIGWALGRAPARSATVTGMRLAVACLAAVAGLGMRLAWGFAGGDVPAVRQSLLVAHLGLGLLGWVGGLWMAVGWQVVPMFWMTHNPSEGRARWQLSLVAGSAVGALGLAAAGVAWPWVARALVPAAAAVWVVQPLDLARQLRARRRKRPDPALTLWLLSLACAPLAFGLAAAWVAVDWPPLGPLVGWVVLWGWAGGAIHAALAKIVPFLAWFHRFAQTAHDPALQAQVPPIKQLLTDRQVRVGVALHTAALALGVAATVTTWDPLAHCAGLAVAACGVALGANLALPVWRAARVGRSVAN